jgi:hypothetical protein
MSSVAERLSDAGEMHKARLHFVRFTFRTSVSKYKSINNVSVHMTDESQEAFHPNEQQLCVTSQSKIYPVI